MQVVQTRTVPPPGVAASADWGGSSLPCRLGWVVPRLRGDDKAAVAWEKVRCSCPCKRCECMGRSGRMQSATEMGNRVLGFLSPSHISFDTDMLFMAESKIVCLQMETFIMLTSKMFFSTSTQRPGMGRLRGGVVGRGCGGRAQQPTQQARGQEGLLLTGPLGPHRFILPLINLTGLIESPHVTTVWPRLTRSSTVPTGHPTALTVSVCQEGVFTYLSLGPVCSVDAGGTNNHHWAPTRGRSSQLPHSTRQAHIRDKHTCQTPGGTTI